MKKNIAAEFHSDQTWNDGALGFFWRGRPKNKEKQKKNKMTSNMTSVPDLETTHQNTWRLGLLPQTLRAYTTFQGL